jgi:hypothetical protein
VVVGVRKSCGWRWDAARNWTSRADAVVLWVFANAQHVEQNLVLEGAVHACTVVGWIVYLIFVASGVRAWFVVAAAE